MGVMSNRRLPAPNAPGGAFSDIISDLHSEGHISPRRFRAGVVLLIDWQAAHGRSVGLVGSTAEKVQTGFRERLCPTGGPSIAGFDQRLHRLPPHQRQLLKELVTSKEHARGSLSDIGRRHSGYQTARTARAVAVGMIVVLLDAVAEVWLGPEVV